MNPAAPDLARLHQRLDTLAARCGFERVDAESFGAFAGRPGTALVLFAEDPARVPQTWDLTVILPEIVAGLAAPPRVGLLAPDAARILAARHGIRVWPALVGLRDGAHLGSIEGLMDWSAYARLVPALLAAPAARPPGIGVPVRHAPPAGGCH